MTKVTVEFATGKDPLQFVDRSFVRVSVRSNEIRSDGTKRWVSQDVPCPNGARDLGTEQIKRAVVAAGALLAEYLVEKGLDLIEPVECATAVLVAYEKMLRLRETRQGEQG